MSAHNLGSKFVTDLKFEVVWVDAHFLFFCKTKPAPPNKHTQHKQNKAKLFRNKAFLLEFESFTFFT